MAVILWPASLSMSCSEDEVSLGVCVGGEQVIEMSNTMSTGVLSSTLMA